MCARSPDLACVDAVFNFMLIPNGICVPDSADMREQRVLELAERSAQPHGWPAPDAHAAFARRR